MSRLLCESIDASTIPEGLRTELSALPVESWDTGLAPVLELRRRLLEAQRFRCAYCQVTIAGDQGGLRELDHVLPKEMSGKCDIRKCMSSHFSDRRHTLGYPEFRYMWKNLVVTCKQCNTNKGSFDPLFIRPYWSGEYPDTALQFLWVHPHFHSYSDHVHITDKWLYVARSYEGDTLIRVCKLDKSEVLARRKLVDACAAQVESLRAFMHAVSGRYTEVNPDRCVEVLVDKYGVPAGAATELVDAWFTHASKVSVESLAKAIALTERLETAALPAQNEPTTTELL